MTPHGTEHALALPTFEALKRAVDACPTDAELPSRFQVRRGDALVDVLVVPERDVAANSVLGQNDFSSADEWPYGPHSGDRFRFPYAVALNEGRLSAIRPVAELDMEQIGLMMGGAHDMEVAHVDA